MCLPQWAEQANLQRLIVIKKQRAETTTTSQVSFVLYVVGWGHTGRTDRKHVQSPIYFGVLVLHQRDSSWALPRASHEHFHGDDRVSGSSESDADAAKYGPWRPGRGHHWKNWWMFAIFSVLLPDQGFRFWKLHYGDLVCPSHFCPGANHGTCHEFDEWWRWKVSSGRASSVQKGSWKIQGPSPDEYPHRPATALKLNI